MFFLKQFGQFQNFLFQQGIENIVAMVAPMNAVKLEQGFIGFESLIFMNIRKGLKDIDDRQMIFFCQL